MKGSARVWAAIAVAAIVLVPGLSACGSSNDTTGSSGGGGGGKTIVSNPANGKVTLTIGSKNFTEQIVLGEIYSQALGAATGLPVREVVFVYCKAGVEVRLREGSVVNGSTR